MCPALGSPAVLFPTPNMNLFSRSPTVSEFCPFLLKSTLTIFMPILKIRVMHLQYFHYFEFFLLLIANGVGEAVAGAAKIVLRKPKPYMDSSGPSSRQRRNFLFFVVF